MTKPIYIMDCKNCTKEFCDDCAMLKSLECAGLLDKYTIVYGSGKQQKSLNM